MYFWRKKEVCCQARRNLCFASYNLWLCQWLTHEVIGIAAIAFFFVKMNPAYPSPQFFVIFFCLPRLWHLLLSDNLWHGPLDPWFIGRQNLYEGGYSLLLLSKGFTS